MAWMPSPASGGPDSGSAKESPESAAASTSRRTTVVELGSNNEYAYVLGGEPEHTLQLTPSSDLDFLACIHIRPDGGSPSRQIQESLARFAAEDDVFHARFARTLLVILPDGHPFPADHQKLLASLKCLAVHVHLRSTCPDVAPGPYFFSDRGLFRVRRLYEDTQEAFIASTVPSLRDVNRYEHLAASAFGAATLCVAAPSRLYSVPSPDRPLAGLRIAVKDVFDLRGTWTGRGNRAYRRLHSEPAESTSRAVQAALEKGAVVVGKTKTVEFAGSQEVTADWVDYSYALNPRADGYLAATGSSTGSAVGLAAYPWLDVAVGSDAGGSIRDPAVAQGVYGLRPSHDGGSAETPGLNCPLFHTAGFLARSCEIMLEFGRNWLASPSLEPQTLRPARVLFPANYYSDRQDVQAAARAWVERLAKWLGVGVCTGTVEDKWKTTKPRGVEDSFEDYFADTFLDVLFSDYWQHEQPFLEEYRARFGKEPYVCKLTRSIWKAGAIIPQEKKTRRLGEVKEHNEWFTQHFLGDAVMIVPRYWLRYRDEYPTGLDDGDLRKYSENPHMHASLAGLPNLVVPIGQRAYQSDVTKKEEFFPVSVSIVAPKGKDIGLLTLVRDFIVAQGMATSVDTGSVVYKGALASSGD